MDIDDIKSLDDYILEVVKRSLIQNNNNPTIVSKKLGISRATIYRYIKEIEKSSK
jgi:predicted transcriptional regulator YheO